MNYNLRRDEMEDFNAQQRIDKLIFYFLLMVVGFVPLVVMASAKEVVSPIVTNIDLVSTGEKWDLFTYYKVIAILIIPALILILFLYKLFLLNGKLKRIKINYAIILFVSSIFISTYFSSAISIALWGQYNRTEGAITFLCYITLFFIAINIEYPKRVFTYIIYALYPFTIINFMIVSLSFMGHDILQSKTIQKLLTLFLTGGEELTLGSKFVGTLNQWNYMSGMFAILTIIFLFSSIIESTKVRKYFHFIMSLISLSVMLMSISTSGFLTILIVSPLFLIYIIKMNMGKSGIVIVLLFLLLTIPILHTLSEKNPRVWAESIGFFINYNPYKTETLRNTTTNFSIGSNMLMTRVYAIDNRFELPELPERGNAALTSRVYIWEKALDLIQEKPLFGYGLDTLMYNFPHYNIDARAGMWDETAIVDKPHSMYVGILYGTGFVGFVSFLVIAMTIVWNTLKTIFSKRCNAYCIFGVAWIVFLIQAIVNDSVPGMAAPLWILGGIAYSKMRTISGDNLNNNDSKEIEINEITQPSNS